MPHKIPRKSSQNHYQKYMYRLLKYLYLSQILYHKYSLYHLSHHLMMSPELDHYSASGMK
jgi:hypothetical protein